MCGRIYHRLAEVKEGPFIKLWQYIENLTELYNNHFLKEVVSTYIFDYSEDKNPVKFKVGNTVWLICKKSPEHGIWPRAKVSEVITGPDSKIRTIYVEHGGQILKQSIKDVALLLSEPDATTIMTESGVRVLPQFPPNPELYRHEKAGAKYIW